MPPIRFVYFDLDDTLLDHRGAERQALGDLYTQYPTFGHLALEAMQDLYHEHNVEVWRSYARGDLDKAAAKRLRFARLLEACSVGGLDPDALSDYYLHRYSHYWAFCDGAQAAFHAVANRLPVGILTNGFVEIQNAKLARFSDLRPRLAALVISEEVGHLKPHPKLFAHATAAAEVDPQHILYVGDSYHSDVEGALAAGWQVAWYTRLGAVPAEADVFRFDRWEALPAWIDGGAAERR
jgi:HAD superfamily hydrolase (TIGR01549 family)